MRSSAASRPPGRASSSSRTRLSAETIRERRRRGDWVYATLHGHYLDHLAVIEPWTDELRRAGRRASLMPTATDTPSPNLTIEAIVAVDTPREFRLHPRDRVVAYTAEAAGARQLFTLSLRGGYPVQLTASEKPVSDPQWSPDGRRLAFVRDDEIWVVEADGSRLTRVVGKPGARPRPALVARRPSARLPVAPPRLDAGLADRRARPAPRPAGDRAQAAATDRPDRDRHRRRRLRMGARRRPDRGHGPCAGRPSRTVADRPRRRRDGRRRGSSPASAASMSAPRWLPDGSLLFVSDADGWFQVVRLTADGHDRIVLTDGRARARRARRRRRRVRPLPSPDGSRFVHIEVHDGLQDLLVGELGRGARPRSAAADGRRRRPGPSRRPRPAAGSTRGTASGGRSAGWPTAPGSRRSASARRRRRTCGCSPSRASPPTTPGRARSPTRMPAVLRAALSPEPRPDRRSGSPSRRATACASRAPVAPARRRPASAAARASRRSSTRTAARPARRSARSSRSSSSSSPRGSRCSTSTSAARPATAGRSASPTTASGATPTSTTSSTPRAGRPSQPWSDGRLAIYGGSYGGYMVLCALVEEPAHVAGRRRPVRRLGDRRELPPRRPAGPPRPAQDDGLARRSGAQPRSTAAARRSTAPSGSRRRC